MFKTARNLIALGIGLGTSAVVGWLLLKENKRQEQEGSEVKVRSQRRPPEAESLPAIKLPLEALAEAEEAASAQSDAEPDDFTQINGIGPRYAEALVKAGITRFEQLAAQTPEALAELLAPHARVRAERISGNDWIGQAARLAQQ